MYTNRVSYPHIRYNHQHPMWINAYKKAPCIFLFEIKIRRRKYKYTRNFLPVPTSNLTIEKYKSQGWSIFLSFLFYMWSIKKKEKVYDLEHAQIQTHSCLKTHNKREPLCLVMASKQAFHFSFLFALFKGQNKLEFINKNFPLAIASTIIRFFQR